MKIAIPVFENRISPRFDFAPTFLLFNIVGERVTEWKEISCEGNEGIQRISQLKDLGVDTLICGGLPSYLLDLLNNRGIKVIPWISGNASEALVLFLQGRLNSGMVCSGKGRRGRFNRI
jgi:predicted Fe-Mo cluster-binding NifX family protein